MIRKERRTENGHTEACTTKKMVSMEVDQEKTDLLRESTKFWVKSPLRNVYLEELT